MLFDPHIDLLFGHVFQNCQRLSPVIEESDDHMGDLSVGLLVVMGLELDKTHSPTFKKLVQLQFLAPLVLALISARAHFNQGANLADKGVAYHF